MKENEKSEHRLLMKEKRIAYKNSVGKTTGKIDLGIG
jgi:hypothetical protein